jgi:hypothetical protein
MLIEYKYTLDKNQQEMHHTSIIPTNNNHMTNGLPKVTFNMMIPKVNG